MTGVHSGFEACVRNIAPHVQFTLCMIHRHVLAIKTLPNDLADRRGKRAWVTKPFTVDEEVIENSDTAAKLEFLALRG